MRAITDLLAVLRQEPAPQDRYDIRKGTRVPKGPTTMAALADPTEPDGVAPIEAPPA